MNALVDATETSGQAGVLVFEDTEARFDLDHVLTEVIDPTADMAKMFKNNDPGHRTQDRR